MRDLPPLKAVRAFEACYRLRSFTRAAESLNVGQPAISHQIRMLERDLGVKLFEKKGSRILPTEPADDYFEAISDGLGGIARASRKMRERTDKDTIILGTYPGIGTFWALPRIEAFRKRQKGANLKVITGDLNADISLRDCDCAILFGKTGQWPGHQVIPLIREEVVPVASPLLGGRWRKEGGERLLKEAPLIALEDPEKRWLTWTDWRDRFAPNVRRVSPAVTVTNHAVALNLALMGQGIALGWRGVISDLLQNGTLVELDFPIAATDSGYHLILSGDFARTDQGQALAQVLAPESQPGNQP